MQNTLFLVNYKALHLILILIFALLPVMSDASEVNVYSGRKAKLIKPLFDKFENQTGIKVNLVTAKSDALLKRIEAEGASSPADIFITVDAGRLDRAKRMGLLQKINTISFKNRLSKDYMDKDNMWIAISKRIRTIIYSKEKVEKREISRFEDLASNEWKDRICVRSSNNIYNQSLIASLIASVGEEKAESITKKIVKNFARKPSGNDRAQITAVAKGECDVAIVNHYYYILMLNSNDQEKRNIAKKVNILFLNQKDRGSHVNISGLGIARHSKNIENSYKLIEYLLNKESQEWYANVNNEYPVMPNAETNDLLKSWGTVKLDEKSINKLGELNPNAVKLMDRVNWQ